MATRPSAKARVRETLPLRTRRAEASNWPERKFDPVAPQFRFHASVREANLCRRTQLVLEANLPRPLWSELPHPPLNQPERMREFL